MEVVEEIDLAPFYAEISEDIGYHTGGTASAIDDFRIDSEKSSD